MQRKIKYGERVHSTISAMPGGKAEEILRKIAHPGRGNNPTHNAREFGEWVGGRCIGIVRPGNEEPVKITLVIGQREGLYLEDANEGASLSLKDWTKDVLKVGAKIPNYRLYDAANQIVACWILHGKFWVNRSAQVMDWPYGCDSNREIHAFFKVIDGAEERVSLGDLIKEGAVRSTHVGQWNRPYALIPAACGMRVLMHEFRQTSEDVIVFGGKRISPDPEIVWGPYCRWSDRSLGEVREKVFQEIAFETASPFGFHVHATKVAFPNTTLASSFILDRLGKDLLRKILQTVAEKEPERFYRMIDEEGKTYQLVRNIENRELEFENKKDVRPRFFRLSLAADNVIETLEELASIEKDLRFVIKRRARLVLDSHFYLVCFGIAESKDGRARHLSGSEMYRYLVKGADAKMHKIRNERLYRALKDVMGLNGDSFEFHIYPPVEYLGETQYTADPALIKEKKEKWLKQIVA